jgi:hypothetical protein
MIDVAKTQQRHSYYAVQKTLYVYNLNPFLYPALDCMERTSMRDAFKARETGRRSTNNGLFDGAVLKVQSQSCAIGSSRVAPGYFFGAAKKIAVGASRPGGPVTNREKPARWNEEQGPHLWGCDRESAHEPADSTRALSARYRVAPTATRQALLRRPRAVSLRYLSSFGSPCSLRRGDNDVGGAASAPPVRQ